MKLLMKMERKDTEQNQKKKQKERLLAYKKVLQSMKKGTGEGKRGGSVQKGDKG